MCKSNSSSQRFILAAARSRVDARARARSRVQAEESASTRPRVYDAFYRWITIIGRVLVETWLTFVLPLVSPLRRRATSRRHFRLSYDRTRYTADAK